MKFFPALAILASTVSALSSPPRIRTRRIPPRTGSGPRSGTSLPPAVGTSVSIGTNTGLFLSVALGVSDSLGLVLTLRLGWLAPGVAALWVGLQVSRLALRGDCFGGLQGEWVGRLFGDGSAFVGFPCLPFLSLG